MARTEEEYREAERQRNARRANDPHYRAKCAARKKKWYMAHREEHMARSRAWAKANGAKHRESVRNWQRAHPLDAEEQRRRNRAWAAKYRDRIREKRKAEWKAMPAEQKAEKRLAIARSELRRKERIAGRARPTVCEICGGMDEKKSIAFDHDHVTGAFRGWICDACNLILGLARDDAERLFKLAEYLTQSRELVCVK